MSQGKSILVDASRCTACRGCQVACKQWNQLPAVKTEQRGTYQNPPDFTPETYKVVRFAEGKKDGKPYWYFFSDMCRHCVTPPCQAGASGDEIVVDEATGAVLYTKDSANMDFETARSVCPYDVPRQDPKTKKVTKCTMCVDRVKAGQKPACVLSCPTEAIVFGERNEILALAEKRVAELKKTHPKAKALDASDVRVIYVVVDDPKLYSETAEA